MSDLHQFLKVKIFKIRLIAVLFDLSFKLKDKLNLDSGHIYQISPRFYTVPGQKFENFNDDGAI